MIFSKIVALICLAGFVSGQPILPADEVESLRAIARTLGKSDWDFSVDPCSGLSGWVTLNPANGNDNALTCDCTFQNNTVCHVVSIILKAQNLSGSVPREIIRLPFLREISLLGNRVTGPIPRALANISTLANLTLDYNQLSGTIPPEFGNFPRIEKLVFTSNNLTGELPANLARLSTLRDFRIGDNDFRGSIPNFIQNWTNIEKLIIQGSGLSGPIPAGIASLTRLTDLRISDLSGSDSAFPRLSNITKLKTLILRSCNIAGQMPSYIGEMAGLKILDLSFNKLSGPIPHSIVGLSETDYIYLTGNSLSGPLPDWMLIDGESMDLSYNNLTSTDSAPSCQTRTLNLFASSKGNSSGIVSCLRISRCEREYYSLHINCGGRQVADDKGVIYEDMQTREAPRISFGIGETGDIATRATLWMKTGTATRSSCKTVQNGNYTVNLHFAEIILTNDQTYYSVGRRLFDVYIQGKLVLKDFNIEREADGVNRPIRRNFTAVVTDSSLDIRFYWAGKGTNGIPFRGVYGPLISAISVEPNYAPPVEKGDGRISTGAANTLKMEGNLMKLVDPRIGSKFNEEEAMTTIHLGLLCTNAVAAERPNMSAVVSILEGKSGLQEFLSDPNFSTGQLNKNPKEMEAINDDGPGKSLLMDGPWTASSAASTADLYPITLDSKYWEKRDQ
ncbi:hypothetical protein CASFOL_022654 [Castilleja foliolosa]|uniref:non-specific serine/threonine protein kinase n=1 Tax=Castilleja foliolosa TaxID=1961234 RepID=A0ABD3CWP7_9LAMI